MNRKPGRLAAASASLFQALFETAPDAMIVADRSGRIVLANPQAEQLFGYPTHGLDGQMIEVLLPQSVRAAHTVHRERYMSGPKARPMGAGYELTGVRRNGQEFPVEIGLSPIAADGHALFAASIRDISETQRARQALVRARYDTFVAQVGRLLLNAPNYEAAIDSIPTLLASALEAGVVAIVLKSPHDPELRVRAATGLPANLHDALEQAASRDQLIDKLASRDLAAIVLERAPPEEFAALSAVLKDAGLQGAALVPLFDRYEPMGILLAAAAEADSFDHDKLHFLQSVANMLAAAMQRSRSEEQLAHAQRLDALGQLTGGIAHDFNNWLTVISGNLQLLEVEVEIPPASRKVMESASRAVDHCTALTRKLLGFARRRRLVPRPLQPAQVLADLVEMLGRTLGARIEVRVECPNRIPAVFADPVELDAALVNLAVNARDAMPGGGTLFFGAHERRVDEGAQDAVLRPGQYVMFTVADNGSGMTREVLGRALEPFYTTKAAGKGSGLGLSMVYGFARQSGGELTIDSHPGLGTRIELLLPAAPTDADEEISSSPSAPGTGQAVILVVEDEPEVRTIAVSFMRSLGYVTHEAADAAGALEVLRQQPQIQLLFSDVMLGSGMTGLELALEARRLYPQLPVLLTSGHDPSPLNSSDASGDFELLRKPYRRDELAHALQRKLQPVAQH